MSDLGGYDNGPGDGKVRASIPELRKTIVSACFGWRPRFDVSSVACVSFGEGLADGGQNFEFLGVAACIPCGVNQQGQGCPSDS